MRRRICVAAALFALSLAFLGYSVGVYYRDRAVRQAVLERRYEAYLNDPALRPQLLYNLGTQALQEAIELGQPERLVSSLSYLRQALRERPEFPEARHNYELALALLAAQRKAEVEQEVQMPAEERGQPKEEVRPSFAELHDI